MAGESRSVHSYSIGHVVRIEHEPGELGQFVVAEVSEAASIQSAVPFAGDELTVLIIRSVTLTYDYTLLLLGGEVLNLIVVEVYMAVLNLAVRSLNESQVIDLSVDTER